MNDTSRLAAAVQERYVLERELGAGGMATVYLAHDRKLDRDVALKVLRPELGAILGQERFLAEIRITARLDHPHILTLIDSGAADGFLYYVMPYVRGESLRERLRRETQLGLDEAVAFARQVASALDFAHRQGVVHRDLKPENILLQEGEAMLADFGIALAVREAGGARLTESGLSLGTPGYMSPEQATGDRALDARSDVYSLAAVVYEMISGEPPIAGATAQAMIARLLTEAPTPLRTLRASVPPAMDAAVAKALAKSPSDRFATAGEFAAALTAALAPQVTAATTGVGGGQARGRRTALLVTTAAVIGVAGWAALRERPLALEIGRAESLTTDAGLEIQPDISPQGNLVAYAAGGLGAMRVYVKPITGGRAIAVADEGAPQQSSPRWSPTGDRLAFLMGGGVHVVPALGGRVLRVVAPVPPLSVNSVTWSPDGAELAYVRADTLFATRVEGGATRVLGTAISLHTCDWSPAGRWIACVAGNGAVNIPSEQFGNVAPSDLAVFPAAGGEPAIVETGGTELLSPRFMPGTDALLVVSNRDGPRDVYAWRLDRKGALRGAPTRLTTGLGAHTIAISRDGSRIAFAAYNAKANIWAIPFVPERETQATPAVATALTSGTQIVEFVSVSPDGRWLMYDSNLRGNFDIWRLPIGGGEPERLTEDPADEFAGSLSPDGTEIAYHSWRTGSRDIEVKRLDAGTATSVTATPEPASESYPTWSPSGNALVFIDQGAGGGPRIIARQDGVWGRPMSLPGNFTSRPDWSSNGQIVVGRGTSEVAVGEASDTSAPVALRTVWNASGPEPRLENALWTRDGRWLVLKSHGGRARTSFWLLDARGGVPRRIVTFPDPRFQSARRDFAVSDTQLFFPVEERESDVQTAVIRRP